MSTRDAYQRIRRAGYILRVVEVEGEVKLRVSKPPHPAEELRDYIKEHRDELITHIGQGILRTESEVFAFAAEFFGITSFTTDFTISRESIKASEETKGA